MANRNYFNNLSKTHKTYASSHFIVGLEGEIVRCIPDDEVAFHSGSYSMNRKSIGIETCHPDWGGKFNDKTYQSLIELIAYLCKIYNISVNNIIRHYDVTGKACPKYYVEHLDAWNKLREDVNSKLTGKPELPNNNGSEEKARLRYNNGSTKENIFADTALTKKIGYLSPYETCDCYGIFEGRALVRYKVDGKNNYKIGFAKWIGRSKTIS